MRRHSGCECDIIGKVLEIVATISFFSDSFHYLEVWSGPYAGLLVAVFLCGIVGLGWADLSPTPVHLSGSSEAQCRILAIAH